MEDAAIAAAKSKTPASPAARARRSAEAKAAADAARAQAKELLAAKPVREATSFRPYLTAERNAAVKAAEALRDGDIAKYRELKAKQMLNHALCRRGHARTARSPKRRHDLSVEQYGERGKQTCKDMPYGFVRQMDALLERGGMRLPQAGGFEQTLTAIAEDDGAKGQGPLSTIANATGLLTDATAPVRLAEGPCLHFVASGSRPTITS
jgi:hypothetical protein